MKKLNILLVLFFALSFSTEIKAQCWIDTDVIISFEDEKFENRCTYNISVCADKIPASVSLLIFELTSGSDVYTKQLETLGNTGDREYVHFYGVEFDCAAMLTITMTAIKPGPDCVEVLDLIELPEPLLPVTLDKFNVEATNESVVLFWSTIAEYNHFGFDIERSDDGGKYYLIGNVSSDLKTVSTQNYKFIDDNPIYGVNYYRLKQLDYNGDYEYFGPRVITFAPSNETQISVRPIPTDTDLLVSVSSPKYPTTMYLTDVFGNRIKAIEVADGKEISVELDNLVSGTYILYINGTAEKFIKI